MAPKSKKVKNAQEVDDASVKTVDASNAEKNSLSGKDVLLWGVAILLLIVAIGGNYALNKYYEDFFAESSLYQLLKAFGVIILILLSVVAMAFTKTGKHIINFARESYIEVRRVVWPTGQEARTTTVYVGIITVFVAFLLWVFDFIFMTLISLINKI